LKKPILVAANKMDEEVSAENLKRFKKKFKKVKIWKISCLTGEGLDELKVELKEQVKEGKK
jgi:GTPase